MAVAVAEYSVFLWISPIPFRYSEIKKATEVYSFTAESFAYETIISGYVRI